MNEREGINDRGREGGKERGREGGREGGKEGRRAVTTNQYCNSVERERECKSTALRPMKSMVAWYRSYNSEIC